MAAICLLAVSVANAQQMTPVFNEKIHPTKKLSFDTKKYAKNKNGIARTSVVQSGWFCTGVAIDNLLSNVGVVNNYPFFPDTMGKFIFSNGNYSTFVHSLGEVLDPKGFQFTGDPATDFIYSPTPQSYSLDSMSIVYSYERNDPNVNIVDTLIVMIASNTPTTNLLGGYYAAATATFVSNYGTDTLQLHRPKYTYTTQYLNATGSIRFKIPLTINDTATAFLNEKFFALPSAYNFNASKVVIASVTFKPGYAYTEGSVISTMGNVFTFASFEENGANSYPLYQDCNLSSPSCDYNNSLIINNDVRYNTPAAGGFAGSFLPSYAFGQAYRFEHHLLSFKLTAGNVGVKSVASQNEFSLGQNVPNPFTKESLVKYTLAKDVNSALFTITDVTGRIISTETVGTSTGTHSVKLGALASGLYYYSLNVDGNVTTKKMIVE